MSLLRWLSSTKTRNNPANELITDDNAASTSSPAELNTTPVATSSSTVDVLDTLAPVSKVETVKSKTSVRRKINNEWKTEFNWCEFADGKVFCNDCLQASRAKNKVGRRITNNSFVTGSSNLQRSALARHQVSGDHRLAVSVLQQKVQMDEHVASLAEAAKDSVSAQMLTAVSMAANDIPDTKFVPLLLMQKLNGAQTLQDESAWYTGHCIVREMQEASADVCKNRLIERLKSSTFVGLMIDESLDIAIKKKLVVYFKAVVNGEPIITFGGNVEVENGKAATLVTAVRTVLTEYDIPIEKVIGIGSDGASVMIGSKNGFVTVFKRLNPSIIGVWCCAHRLSLVCQWASNSIAALKIIQETLVRVYKYFKYSAVRNNDLKKLKAIMQEKVKKFKKPTSVRWLSLEDAVIAAQESWGSLVLTLEHEVTANEGDTATSLSLLKEVKTYKFIAHLCLLRDVLGPLTKCSKSFQRDFIDVEQAMGMLGATMDAILALPECPGQYLTRLHDCLQAKEACQGISFTISISQVVETTNLSKAFVSAIKTQADRRFPSNGMNVLKSLDKILNPKHLPEGALQMNEYGRKDLEFLTEIFPQVENDRLIGDYTLFKYFLNRNRNLSLQAICTKIIKDHSEQFPDFATLAKISLVVPLSSVPCERAFSLQNAILNSKRNSMSVQSVANKMLIIEEKRHCCKDSSDRSNEAKFICDLCNESVKAFAKRKRLRLK